MINIEQFGGRAGSGADTTPAVRAAVDACRKQADHHLIFPAGRYDFWPDKAAERYLFISNNTEGLKRVAFPLFDLDGFHVDGQNSEFVFHGEVLPFAVWGCRGIHLTSFSVDWERPFHSEGRIADVGDGWVDVEFSREFPYTIKNNRLVFTGEKDAEHFFHNVLEFDAGKRETAWQAEDNYGIENRYEAREMGAGRVRLTAHLNSAPTVGNVLVFASDHRKYPAIAVSDSQRVTVEDVTLHHSGGMGIVAQLTTDITVRRVRVTPPAGRERIVSLSADATHFVNCRGHIEMAECLFEGQMDDATNVHGIYAKITARVSERVLEVALIHGEQLGVDIFAPGDTAELVAGATLVTYHTGTVTAVRRLNKEYSEITFAEDLPASIGPADAVLCRDANADLTIRGCTARGNRARGFLVSTSGRVAIADNTFHTPGAAILIGGEARYWFECGPVRDVTIRGNHFDNCNHGVWGRACIDICPDIAPEHRAGTVYHRGIRVENNRFDVFNPRLLDAYCVQELTVMGNDVRVSTAYPGPAQRTASFAITNAQDVHVQDVPCPE